MCESLRSVAVVRAEIKAECAAEAQDAQTNAPRRHIDLRRLTYGT